MGPGGAPRARAGARARGGAGASSSARKTPPPGLEVRRARAPAEHAAAAALRAGVFFSCPLCEDGVYIGPQAEAAQAAWLERQAAAELKKMRAVPGCSCLVALGAGAGGEGGVVPGSLGGAHEDAAGRVVGTLHYTTDAPRAQLRGQAPPPTEHSSPTVAYLFNICVAEDHRRAGVGGALMDEAHGLLAEQGVATTYVHVEEANLAGREFYRVLGYREAELGVDSWSYISGKGDGGSGRSLLSKSLSG